jgi:beta-carotene 15,15'-dioxygenase
MKHPLRIILLGLGLLLLAFYTLLQWTETTQLYFFAISILLTGIPHGALDFFLERENAKQASSSFSIQRFFLFYLLNMLAYGLLWYVLPSLALGLFIVITAWHFGEIDAHLLHLNRFSKAIHFFYGLGIILFIISSHAAASAAILQYILPRQISSAQYVIYNAILFNFCCLSLVLILSLVAIYAYKNEQYRASGFSFVMQSLLLLVLIYFLPFYLSFAFYFGLWHSSLSFEIIRNQLNLKNDWIGWKTLILKALPYSIVALLGLAMIIALVRSSYQIAEIVSGLFIGIAILTLPHLQIFSKTMTQQKKR